MATRVSRGVPLIKISRFTRIVSRATARGAAGLPNVEGRPPALQRPAAVQESIDRHRCRPGPIGDGTGARGHPDLHLQPAAAPHQGVAHLSIVDATLPHLRPTQIRLAHGARDHARARQEETISGLRRSMELHSDELNVLHLWTYVNSPRVAEGPRAGRRLGV
jgi:hypothetical protein